MIKDKRLIPSILFVKINSLFLLKKLYFLIQKKATVLKIEI